jgi:hypothetical protein
LCPGVKVITITDVIHKLGKIIFTRKTRTLVQISAWTFDCFIIDRRSYWLLNWSIVLCWLLINARAHRSDDQSSWPYHVWGEGPSNFFI